MQTHELWTQIESIAHNLYTFRFRCIAWHSDILCKLLYCLQDQCQLERYYFNRHFFHSIIWLYSLVSWLRWLNWAAMMNKQKREKKQTKYAQKEYHSCLHVTLWLCVFRRQLVDSEIAASKSSHIERKYNCAYISAQKMNGNKVK